MKLNISSLPGIYIHIPFCQHKCGYCDFYSVTNQSLREKFLHALVREMKIQSEIIPSDTVFDTVYLGGGTPSLLTLKELEYILSHLHNLFRLHADCEMTLEANPGTLSPDLLTGYHSQDINRLSIGVQSFLDHELKILERIHSAAEARESIQMARQAGFDNLSIDLIFAIPGQSGEDWKSNLRQAMDFRPEHISAYNLTYEAGTPFYEKRAMGVMTTPDEEQEAELYRITLEELEPRGYRGYEISNYARENRFVSRHNIKYWTHTPYLGFGPSAHSFWNLERTANVRNLEVYLNALENGNLPIAEHERIDGPKLEFEHIFLSLRRREGLALAGFREQFGRPFAESYATIVQPLIAAGLAQLDTRSFRLTVKGLYLCDEIIAQFAAH